MHCTDVTSPKTAASRNVKSEQFSENPLITAGTAALVLLAPWWPWALLPLGLYALLVCVDSACRNRSARIGIYSIAAAFVQLIGYGSGFWRAWWQRCVLDRQEETQAFRRNFYK